MIPRTLDEWNVSTIKELLEKGYYESEYFDFKEMLPHSQDAKGKQRLIKACCAFANSMGGFLVFGILDDKSRTPEERLVGINASMDFPEHFGHYPQACTPGVEWNFKNPAIGLGNGNVIHVVHILKSWNMPHALNDKENNWSFPKRTNKGDELMNFDEIRTSFLGYYEKRLKLDLLKNELHTIDTQARLMMLDETNWEKEYPVTTFSIGVVESVLSETYIMLAQDPSLLALLSAIRSQCRLINNRQSIFFTQAALPTLGKESLVRSHNQYLHSAIPPVLSWCSDAIKTLEGMLNPS